VISNPNSDDGNDALVNIINVPNRYIGRKFIQELKDFSSRRGVHLYEGLKSMGIDLVYVRKNVRDFISFMDPLIDDAGNLMPSEVIQLLRSSLDYDRYITDEDIPSPDDVKIANLNQLQLAAARYSSLQSVS
jgi:DNA helicase-2/ATP-dependent DNA helicase PcrA